MNERTINVSNNRPNPMVVPTWPIRDDEVLQAWRIVDPYLTAWSEPGGGFHFYPAGSWGPHMADLLVERSGDEWRNPVLDLERADGPLSQ